METSSVARVGVSGTGMIARSFVQLIANHYKDMRIARVLTRRPLASLADFPLPAALTCSLNDLVDHADIIVECSGDVVHGTEVIERAFAAGLPVVTVNAELQVTTGSYLAARGLLTEAEGDQPGSLAALREDALQMGFVPLVYGNMKGYLNLDPSPDEMAYWASRQGISVEQTTSFTDGTKLQIEQALVGNCFGATITHQGMEGLASTSLNESASMLGMMADRLGQPIVDYLIPQGYPAGGVFLVCRHDTDQVPTLDYLKLGSGPYYALLRPFHLCSLEVGKTLRRVLAGRGVLINNSTKPTLSVAAIAKHPMRAGEAIVRGIGGYQFRGETLLIAQNPDHVPIGLLAQATLRRPLEPGQMVTFDDVELMPSRALDIVMQQRLDLATPEFLLSPWRPQPAQDSHLQPPLLQVGS